MKLIFFVLLAFLISVAPTSETTSIFLIALLLQFSILASGAFSMKINLEA